MIVDRVECTAAAACVFLAWEAGVFTRHQGQEPLEVVRLRLEMLNVAQELMDQLVENERSRP
jgi:ferredoxin